MASPGTLMAVISEATGAPLPTVTDMDRRLTKAGLRTKGGRGLNAARMTSMDAGRLLTAILASAQSKEAAEAVERYARTRPDKDRSSDRLFATADLDDLAALPARHGFVDALAALIGSCVDGTLAKLMEAKNGWTPHIEIFAFTRATRGRIRIAGLPNHLTTSVEYAPPIRSGSMSADGDLEQSRRITARTILAIADLLREETSDDARSA